MMSHFTPDGQPTSMAVVYRALNLLLRMGLIHRIEILNAYVVCRLGAVLYCAGFLICDACGAAEEHKLDRLPLFIAAQGRRGVVSGSAALSASPTRAANVTLLADWSDGHDAFDHGPFNALLLRFARASTDGVTRVDYEALDAAAGTYVNHPRGVRFEGDSLVVSSIYRWYASDFGGSDVATIAHLRGFAAAPLRARLDAAHRIARDDHDWSLNAAPVRR